MARPTPLRLERLEDRAVPALFGIPWADARHLTLSFVSDGTNVDGVDSNLFKAMPGKTPGWQGEILRAVETWAANANINVSVVKEVGKFDLGSSGAPQGDRRFGDIRIAARPLSGNVLAVTTPSGFLGGTRVGDIVLNSNVKFAINGRADGYDLYSVMLQEVGHALGISNSTDPNSPMYETYHGLREGLTDGDIANLQALYGQRAPDALEGPNGNDTLANATELKVPTGADVHSTLVGLGDISGPTDVDYYKVMVPKDGAKDGLTVQLNTGVGLLQAKVTVWDAKGNVLFSGPVPNTLVTYKLNRPDAGSYYYAKIEAANPAFGTGAYQFRVGFDDGAPDVTVQGSTAPLDDKHTDDMAAAATPLTTAAGYVANTHYSALGRLRDYYDVDFYRFHAPVPGANQQNVMTVNVRGVTAGVQSPVMILYDGAGNLVSTQILANGGGTYTFQVSNVAPDQDYVVGVGDAHLGAGNYQLDIDFRTQAVNLQQFGSGTLAPTGSVAYQTLQSNISQMMYFVLSADAADLSVQSGVRMTIFDSNGHAVSTLFARAGQTVSATVYLTQGTYTVRYEGLSPAGATTTAINYSLKGVTLSDPIGPTGSDPTGGGLTNYGWSQNSLSYYTALTLDTLAAIIW